MTSYDAIVMGLSAGGLDVLETVFPQLPDVLSIPIMIVQHRGKSQDNYICRHLARFCSCDVKEAEDKMPVKPGSIYIAPSDYHMMVEMDQTLSLSVDPPVNFSRPSVDVLFETAAEVYKERLVGVVMTGANDDGSMGLKKIKQFGGLLVVQDPKTATAPQMPLATIDAADVDHILTVEDIGKFLASLMDVKIR